MSSCRGARLIRLRGLATLRKQVAWLQTGLAAFRRLYSCSPTRTEMGAPASERQLATSEDPRRKGLKHLIHTRSDGIRCTTTLERVELTSEKQLALTQTFCKQRKRAKHVPAAASDSHIARIFLFSCLPFGRGETLLASLHEAGASFRHAATRRTHRKCS